MTLELPDWLCPPVVPASLVEPEPPAADVLIVLHSPLVHVWPLGHTTPSHGQGPQAPVSPLQHWLVGQVLLSATHWLVTHCRMEGSQSCADVHVVAQVGTQAPL